MLAIYKKEIRSYFYSPIAYVIIGLFVLIMAFLFYTLNFQAMSADFSTAFLMGSMLLIIISPILTMRTLAEDRRSGVEVILITSPTSIASIIVGKYFAALTIFLIMTASTAIFPIIMSFFGTVAVAQLLCTYLGFILLGASFIAVGVFASSLTENQIVAAIVGFVIMVAMYFLSLIGSVVGGTIAEILNWLSLTYKYGSFPSGILNLSDIIYFLSFISIFIFLTIRVVEKRRWSKG